MLLRGKSIRNEPAYRPRSRRIDSYYVYRGGDFAAYVSKEALADMANDASKAQPDETIGYLLGRPYRDDKGVYVVVTTAPRAMAARRDRMSVETTLDDEQWVSGVLEKEQPLAEKVGWWHSHPFGMPQFSKVDHENQRLVCPRSYQLGLLVCIDDDFIRIHAFAGPTGRRLGEPYVCRNTADSQPKLVDAVNSSSRKQRKTEITKFSVRRIVWLTLLVGGLGWTLHMFGPWAAPEGKTGPADKNHLEVADGSEKEGEKIQRAPKTPELASLVKKMEALDQEIKSVQKRLAAVERVVVDRRTEQEGREASEDAPTSDQCGK